MTVRFQRLLLIVFSLVFLLTSILLILFNSKKNLVFFYTPSELLASNAAVNDTVRIGGFVKKNSITNLNKQYNFIVTDNEKNIKVSYTGLLPDLFREEQGVVIEGKLLKDFIVQANTVFAKHDENYMPASIQKQLENSKYWKKRYK